MESPEPKPCLRPRISLLSLLLLTGLVACGIVIAQQARELAPLRVEVKRLKAERGDLVVDDSSRLYATKIPNHFVVDYQYGFRVWAPKGRTYYAVMMIEGIPRLGIPQVERDPTGMSLGRSGKYAFAQLDPGENVLFLRREKVDENEWGVRLKMAGPTFADVESSTRLEAPNSSPESTSHHLYTSGVGAATETTKGTEPLVLLRHRWLPSFHIREPGHYDTLESPTDPPQDLDGILLWVTPKESLLPPPPPSR